MSARVALVLALVLAPATPVSSDAPPAPRLGPAATSRSW